MNSTKAVDDQVSKGIYKILAICGICIPLFLLLVVLYMWRPATGRRLAEADAVYPWLMFVVPEIVSSLVVLYLISPTSKGFYRRLKKCECWSELGDWIKWTSKSQEALLRVALGLHINLFRSIQSRTVSFVARVAVGSGF